MSSAGLGGRVVTERGLGIMAASGLLVGWIFVGFRVSALRAICVPAQPL
jgi:hypothetical protein